MQKGMYQNGGTVIWLNTLGYVVMFVVLDQGSPQAPKTKDSQYNANTVKARAQFQISRSGLGIVRFMAAKEAG